MILLDTKELYYNTQVYFRNHFIDSLPNDEIAWCKAYQEWLLEQGAVIIQSPKPKLIRTALGVAPRYDQFGFQDPEKATLFALKWA